MTWLDVLRRDLRCVARSRMGPLVATVLLLCTVGVVAVIALLAPAERPPGNRQAVLVVGSLLSFVVPLAALMGSFSAIVGERTTGSVRFLFGLPNSRSDAFLGKFLSRSVLVLGPLAVGTLATAAIVSTTFDEGSFVAIALLGVVSAVFGLLFVGLGLTASTLANSDTQAVGLVVGAFALFRAGWPAMQWVGLQSMADAYPRPEWYYWVGRVNPMNAYVRVTQAFADFEYHPLVTRPPDGGLAATSLEFALAVLVVWTVAAPVLGALYIRRRDLL